MDQEISRQHGLWLTVVGSMHHGSLSRRLNQENESLFISGGWCGWAACLGAGPVQAQDALHHPCPQHRPPCHYLGAQPLHLKPAGSARVHALLPAAGRRTSGVAAAVVSPSLGLGLQVEWYDAALAGHNRARLVGGGPASQRPKDQLYSATACSFVHRVPSPPAPPRPPTLIPVPIGCVSSFASLLCARAHRSVLPLFSRRREMKRLFKSTSPSFIYLFI